MRVLVIGGTRFIGRRLVMQLAASGHEVAVFHRGQKRGALPPSVQHILGDRERLAEHADALRPFRPDVVVDMICYTEKQARAAVEVFGSFAGRLVTISSCDVYRAYGIFARLEKGPLEPTPVREDAPLRAALYIARATGAKLGVALYDYEKILVERAVRSRPSLPATVLRLPMVYGPGDDQHRLAPYLRRMLDGRAAILLNEGMAGWRCLRGYVDDVAAAIALVATSPRSAGQTYNVAERDSFTEVEWVGRIAAVVGWGGKTLVVPDAKMPTGFCTEQDLTVDTTRIRDDLRFEEVVTPGYALRETIRWEREHLPEEAMDYAAEDALVAGAELMTPRPDAAPR
jgi:nucleoside-diphosphate-sugar epimerase